MLQDQSSKCKDILRKTVDIFNPYKKDTDVVQAQADAQAQPEQDPQTTSDFILDQSYMGENGEMQNLESLYKIGTSQLTELHCACGVLCNSKMDLSLHIEKRHHNPKINLED